MAVVIEQPVPIVGSSSREIPMIPSTAANNDEAEKPINITPINHDDPPHPPRFINIEINTVSIIPPKNTPVALCPKPGSFISIIPL